jgi:hypothetical protein
VCIILVEPAALKSDKKRDHHPSAALARARCRSQHFSDLPKRGCGWPLSNLAESGSIFTILAGILSTSRSANRATLLRRARLLHVSH